MAYHDRIEMVNTATGKCVKTHRPDALGGDDGVVDCLKFSADGRSLILGTLSAGIWKYDLATGKSRRLLKQDWSIQGLALLGRDRLAFRSTGFSSPRPGEPGWRVGISTKILYEYQLDMKTGRLRKLGKAKMAPRITVHLSKDLKLDRVLLTRTDGNPSRVFDNHLGPTAVRSPDGAWIILQDCPAHGDRPGRRLHLAPQTAAPH